MVSENELYNNDGKNREFGDVRESGANLSKNNFRMEIGNHQGVNKNHESPDNNHQYYQHEEPAEFEIGDEGIDELNTSGMFCCYLNSNR